MTARGWLVAQGRAVFAAEIARGIGQPLQRVYAELVPLESAGEVRVVPSTNPANGRRECRWEAMDEAATA